MMHDDRYIDISRAAYNIQQLQIYFTDQTARHTASQRLSFLLSGDNHWMKKLHSIQCCHAPKPKTSADKKLCCHREAARQLHISI